MSVADKLGKGSSFGNAPRGGRSARGRAKAVTQGDVPAYELTKLRITEVSPTPLNPRRNFGTDEELARFGEELRRVQLAACVAVSRDAYLELWPDHEGDIGGANFVLVNGERRFRSARAAQLDSLDFVVRDELASSREEFMDQLLKENLEREDFDVVERARGVAQLVEVCASDKGRGSQARAAERLGRDRSWVTNQLVLLRLPEELQGMLSRKELSERDGRALGRKLKDDPNLTARELLDSLATEKESSAREREEANALVAAARQSAASSLSADNKPGPVDPVGATGDTTPASDGVPGPGPTVPTQGLRDGAGSLSADNEPASNSPTLSSGSGDERRLLSADNKPQAIPYEASVVEVRWDDPEDVFQALMDHMPQKARNQLVVMLIDSKDPSDS